MVLLGYMYTSQPLSVLVLELVALFSLSKEVGFSDTEMHVPVFAPAWCCAHTCIQT